MRWIFPDPIDQPAVAALAAELRIPAFAAELLIRRGFTETGKAAAFLDPRLKALRDPFELPDMELAVERTLAAIDRHERIVFYGDYDVDGVTSLALLSRVLRALGAEPVCFLPSRMEEGYGLSTDGVARCLEEHQPALLIAVDCGTTSVAEIARLGERGVDVVVLDHHECAEELPRCVAVVNPKRGQNDRHLCSAGLAFKFAHALLKRRPVAQFDLRCVLDLVALGTVADLVPLLDENRTFVKHGLRQLAESSWPGVRALIEVSGLSAPLNAGHIGFGLGPRLNAAGRLGTARDALELLLTDDPGRGESLARSLDSQNRDRRALEDRVCTEAEAQLATWFVPASHAAIVVGAPEWHQGVVGIVASRLARRHHRPAIVIAFDEAGRGKGSGRSIAGLSLITALGACAAHLTTFGGHALAAGLSLAATSFDAFRDSFLSTARTSLTEEQLLPSIRPEAELPLGSIDLSLLDLLDTLAPFGAGHRQPLFFARGVEPAAEPRVLKEKHASLFLSHRRSRARAIWFNATLPLPPSPWDIAFELARNEYQGQTTAQVQITALRTAVM